jgi:AcrR family transcriptional regulator
MSVAGDRSERASKPPSPRAGDDKATTSRDAILAAAARLFREHGYIGTTLKAIADAAGMTAPALYWYFESKADLLYEFLRSTSDESYRRIESVIGTATDPVERLRRLVTGHVEVQVELLDAARAYDELTFSWDQLIKFVGQDKVAELAVSPRRHVERCRQVLEDGMASGQFSLVDVNTTAFAILNMCERISSWYHPHGPVTPTELARIHVELALRMVGVPLDARGSH